MDHSLRIILLAIFFTIASQTNAQFTYTVQQGDTLWDIAQKFCGQAMRYTEIQELNDLRSTTIFPGDILLLPPDCAPYDSYYPY
jgi:nucleoid-associated protein YgaU